MSATAVPEDVQAYLDANQNKSLLRFITCGSVDDGKSTLIGRLLYESHLVFEDHLAALERHGPSPQHRRSFAPVAQRSLYA